MLRDRLAQFASLHAQEIALLFFVALFIGVVLWLFRDSREDLQRYSQMPLDQDASPTTFKGSRHE